MSATGAMSADLRTVTDQIAGRVTELGSSDLTPPILERVRACVIDWVACAVAGTGQPGPTILRRAELDSSGRRTSTIVGVRRRGSVELAATHNGFASHVLELDDVHLPSLSHVTAPVLAAALAVAEEVGADAETVSRALVAGYESMAAIGRPIGQHMISERHVHPTSFLGYFGAATAAARLYELDAGALVSAWGIAGGQAGGLTEVRGTMSKAYFAGHSAGGGVRAARLAREGFGSARDIVGGPSGVWAAFSPELPVITPGLSVALLENTHKMHASCAMGHPMIDAVIRARQAHSGVAELPTRMELHLPVEAATYLDRPAPANGLDAKFSAQYCALVAWTDGVVGPQQFGDQRVATATPDLLARVVLVPRDDLTLERAEVRIHHHAGVWTSRSDAATSSVTTIEQLEVKFMSLVAPILGEDAATGLLGKLGDWPDVPLAELCADLAHGATDEEGEQRD